MALTRIVLRDFVIVQELNLDLHSGFTALTGETGAGKSILIDALQLVTGARADTGLIREGAARTEVAAEFDCPPHIHPLLEDAGFDVSDTLLLRRTVDTQGRSRAWVNASPATVQQLRTLGEQLLDIHGQHAWQSLTHSAAVRTLLDAYGKVDTSSLAPLWLRWQQARDALEKARGLQDQLQTERDRLAWQIGEIERLAPGHDEWVELNTRHRRLAHGQALMDAAQTATAALDGDEASALQALHAATQALQAQAAIEPTFAEAVQLLDASIAQTQDVVHTLRSYLRKTELDPQLLAELDARLGAWVALSRRLRRPPEELPTLWQNWRDELQRLHQASDLDALETQERNASDSFLRAARIVSRQRAQAAPKLAHAITQAMQGLGMQGGRFEVQLHQLEAAQSSGLDEVQFLVAGHPGSSPRPIGKVASGGELSRIALAISVTTSQLGRAPTLIFDEVDSGVGGAVAETVGRLMQRLGRDRQVLAVTHLPQVAACAGHHLLVAKQTKGNTTSSSVTEVLGEARVQEIARMLGGEKRSDTSLAHARELLTPREPA